MNYRGDVATRFGLLNSEGKRMDQKDLFDLDQITKETDVLILAGGLGTNLYPLTRERSVSSILVAGKFRLIDLPLSNCLHSDLKRVFILTQFNSDSLHRHITQTYRFDHFSPEFVEILAAQQTPENMDWDQGTCDAIRKALMRLKRRCSKYVLILSGDQLYRLDYRQLLKCHIENQADVTVAAKPISQSDCMNYGVLHVDAECRITKFVEKPMGEKECHPLQIPDSVFEKFKIASSGYHYLASMGIYVFNTETLNEVFKKYEGRDFGRDVIPQLLGEKRVQAFLFDGFWSDLGKIRSFYQTNLALTQYFPQFNFYDEKWDFYTRPRFLPSAKINNATVYRSIINEGSIVSGALIQDSIIGIRGVVEQHAQVINTVMFGAEFYENEKSNAVENPDVPRLGIGERSLIKNAILDLNVRIGSDVRILNERNIQYCDEINYSIRDGLVIVPKDAIIPSGTVI